NNLYQPPEQLLLLRTPGSPGLFQNVSAPVMIVLLKLKIINCCYCITFSLSSCGIMCVIVLLCTKLSLTVLLLFSFQAFLDVDEDNLMKTMVIIIDGVEVEIVLMMWS